MKVSKINQRNFSIKI